MIVAGLQMDIAWESPRENFRRVRAETARLAGQGIGLLVLPEMFATGFSMRAEVVSGHSGEVRKFLAGLAQELSTHVLGGYAEPGEERPANTCSLFDPRGHELLRYRKIHPFTLGGEDEHYAAGDRVRTAEVNGVGVTPLICYDLRFPEVFRVAAGRTALFPILANWPEERRETWSVLLRARAMENQAYVLGVNRTGMGGGHSHAGDSVLLDPLGRPLAAPGEGGLVVGEVDPSRVQEIRDRTGFLWDRRPDLYRRLEELRDS
jgi:predicted amidohydrolase